MSKLLRKIAMIAVPAVLAQAVILGFVIAVAKHAREGRSGQPLSGVPEVVQSPAEVAGPGAGQAEARAPASVARVAQGPRPDEVRPPEAERETPGSPTPPGATAQPADRQAQRPPPLRPPTTRYVLQIVGGTGGLAGSVRLGAAKYKLPVEGITEEWQVKEIKNWDGQPARLGADITRKQSGGGIELWGRSAGTGQDTVFLSIRAQEGHVLFERRARFSSEQVNDCVGDVAWVELHCESTNETVFVLTKRLEQEVRLEADGAQGEQKARLKATIEVPGLFDLACREFGPGPPTSLTDEAGYQAELKTELSGNELKISVEYSYDMPSEIREARKAWEEAKKQWEPFEKQLEDAQKAVDAAEAERQKQEKFITDAEQAWNNAKGRRETAERRLGGAQKHLRDVTTQNAPKAVQDRAKDGVNGALEAAEKAILEADEKRKDYEKTVRERRPFVQAAAAQRDQAKAVNQAIHQRGQGPRHILARATERKEYLEKEENGKRASAFGRFSAPLEFKRGSEVIATFHLKPPPP